MPGKLKNSDGTLVSGNPSTKGVEVPRRYNSMSRSALIDELLQIGFDNKQIEGACIHITPDAQRDDEEGQRQRVIISEQVRKQRCVWLQKMQTNGAVFGNDNNAVTLDKVQDKPITRLQLTSERLNWLFGGGLPNGKLILLAGGPGVGKTRICISVSSDVTRQGGRVHYFQGEIADPAEFASMVRPTEPIESLFVIDGCTELDQIAARIKKSKPSLVVLDSIDMLKRSFSSVECRRTMVTLASVAKEANCPFLLIAHQNKQGDVKGSNDIEYLVDVVCYANPSDELRLVSKEFDLTIRSKNRCGPVGRTVMFQHTETGIKEVETVTRHNFKMASV